MNIKCLLGFHTWDGCKCTICGKIQDKQHDWTNDCEKCSKCGTTKENQHDWSKDCEKCTICGKTIDKQHDWSKGGEKCSKCLKTCHHQWTLNCNKCSECGSTWEDIYFSLNKLKPDKIVEIAHFTCVPSLPLFIGNTENSFQAIRQGIQNNSKLKRKEISKIEINRGYLDCMLIIVTLGKEYQTSPGNWHIAECRVFVWPNEDGSVIFSTRSPIEEFFPNVSDLPKGIKRFSNKESDFQDSFTDPRDNNVYKVITIGNQTWLAENLRYKANSNCWAYDDNEETAKKFGYLYNWETAKMVAPKGWHLPSDEEWRALTNHLESNAGGKMKAKTDWNSPNAGATNSSGFNALPASGYFGETFSGLGDCAFFWSSSPSGIEKAWIRQLDSFGGIVLRSDYVWANGFSVRCIKDLEVDEKKKQKEEEELQRLLELDKKLTLEYKKRKEESKSNREEIIKNDIARDGAKSIFTDPRDNNKYKIVTIGSQTWLAENLRYKADSGCWALDNNEENVEKYGYLYDWESAQKVAPKGWHLPSNIDWTILTKYLGGAFPGGKMKAPTTDWEYSEIIGTNESGFSALPVGSRSSNGSFHEFGKWAFFWSSTPGEGEVALSISLDHRALCLPWPNYFDRASGFSVRCIKD